MSTALPQFDESYAERLATELSEDADHRTRLKLLQRSAREAARRADPCPVSCHVLRHSFATHLIEDGYAIGTIQELLARIIHEEQ